MNSREIRDFDIQRPVRGDDRIDLSLRLQYQTAELLREITAQLAELNERNAREANARLELQKLEFNETMPRASRE